MTGGFYCFISEQDSKAIFVNNKFSQFVVQLPSYIDLPVSTNFGWKQSWYVALVDFTLTVGKQRLDTVPTACIVLCDLVSPSYIRGGKAQLLRILAEGSDIAGSLPGQTYYMPVKTHSFNQIEISLVSPTLTDLPSSWPTQEVTVTLTLHFVRE